LIDGLGGGERTKNKAQFFLTRVRKKLITRNAITAETWGKNKKEDGQKYVNKLFGE
jgi:hypothetical protein